MPSTSEAGVFAGCVLSMGCSRMRLTRRAARPSARPAAGRAELSQKVVATSVSPCTLSPITRTVRRVICESASLASRSSRSSHDFERKFGSGGSTRTFVVATAAASATHTARSATVFMFLKPSRPVGCRRVTEPSHSRPLPFWQPWTYFPRERKPREMSCVEHAWYVCSCVSVFDSMLPSLGRFCNGRGPQTAGHVSSRPTKPL